MEREQEELIRADLATAASKLDTAELLQREGKAADSISRSYYAVFHAATALMRAEGLKPTSHRGLKTLLGLHFAKPGLIATDLAKSFERLQEQRENSDYDNFVSYDADDSAKALADAKAFVVAARALVTGKFGVRLE